ncbi:MAG TPA: polysaccharide biosynthesis protein, partial [Candidatus Faecousia gallistercoris]|nr:polysaccharide biosynthesis protein [Candidatus Faecousia gallistercoris]
MALDLEDKILLITGGTGSFGNGVTARLLETGIREIRIFSRDEKKQEDMRRMYRDRFPSSCKKLRFFLGDVREPDSLRAPMEGVNYVIHAAALKQVPSCEFFPTEAVRTNVLGTEHVLQAAVSAGAQAVVCLSTDKAAYPINAMGASKALMEKTAAAKAGTLLPLQTKICCTRCGNVLGTRGSVVPLFLRQIQAGGPLTLTEPGMTRFVMTMDEAIELVLHAVARA